MPYARPSIVTARSLLKQLREHQDDIHTLEQSPFAELLGQEAPTSQSSALDCLASRVQDVLLADSTRDWVRYPILLYKYKC